MYNRSHRGHQVVIAFLDEHLLGRRIELPETLGRMEPELPP